MKAYCEFKNAADARSVQGQTFGMQDTRTGVVWTLCIKFDNLTTGCGPYPLHLVSNLKNPEFTSPTDDLLASRSLFIPCMGSDITLKAVEWVFGPFGCFENYTLEGTNKFGFCLQVNYKNLDMAYMAKICLNNRPMLVNHRTPLTTPVIMNIRYAQVTPSNIVWVGGLEPHVTLGQFEAEFKRFGTIESINFKSGSDCAAIKFETKAAAEKAWRKMKGYLMAGTKTRLKTDYLSKFCENDELANTPATLELMKVVEAAEMKFKTNKAKFATNLNQLCESFGGLFWKGAFKSRRDDFPVNCFHLKGEKSIFNECIADSDYRTTGRKPVLQLNRNKKISNFNKSNLKKKLELADFQNNSCLLLAVSENLPNDLTNGSDPGHKPFRDYIYKTPYGKKNSELAGTMIAIPYCLFVFDKLRSICPKLKFDGRLEECMLVYFVAGTEDL